MLPVYIQLHGTGAVNFSSLRTLKLYIVSILVTSNRGLWWSRVHPVALS